jgi:hypothetical protein
VELRKIVASKLILDWSPEQASGWLKTQYPEKGGALCHGLSLSRHSTQSRLLISRVVSMGRRNTGPKSNLQVFQRLNSFESADSKKTLPCQG